MNPILQQTRKQNAAIKHRQNQVIHISKMLQEALKLSDEDLEEGVNAGIPLKCGDFDILFDCRCFHPWTNVLEIVPEGFESVGYTNTRNPDWMLPSDINGTCATNVPPGDVVEHVLDFIKRQEAGKSLTYPEYPATDGYKIDGWDYEEVEEVHEGVNVAKIAVVIALGILISLIVYYYIRS